MGARGLGFETFLRHVMSFSKTLYSPKLVNFCLTRLKRGYITLTGHFFFHCKRPSTFEPHHEKICFLHMRKTKTHINCTATTPLISTFVFTTKYITSSSIQNFKPLTIFCYCRAWFYQGTAHSSAMLTVHLARKLNWKRSSWNTRYKEFDLHV